MELDQDEVNKIFDKIVYDVLNDPKIQKIAEEQDLLYGRGSLTSEDLKIQFTIWNDDTE